MSQSQEYLFVYGTLLRQSQSPMSVTLSARSTFVGKGSVNGKLYDIGEYPGAVISERKDDKILGEVFSLSQPEQTLRELDIYEACSDNFEWPHEYKRVKAAVTLENGKKLSAWMYAFNLPTESFSWIESGDYISYLGLAVT